MEIEYGIENIIFNLLRCVRCTSRLWVLIELLGGAHTLLKTGREHLAGIVCVVYNMMLLMEN